MTKQNTTAFYQLDNVFIIHLKTYYSSYLKRMTTGSRGWGIIEARQLSPSAPIDTSLTPLLQMKSKALFTLAILWKRILPLSGLGSLSPKRQKQNWWKSWKYKHLKHLLEVNYISKSVCTCSPDMTSSSSMSLRPFLKSSSMFSICVPAFLKWELHQAVKVCKRRKWISFSNITIHRTFWFELNKTGSRFSVPSKSHLDTGYIMWRKHDSGIRVVL